jgi:hypothetical protein
VLSYLEKYVKKCVSCPVPMHLTLQYDKLIITWIQVINATAFKRREANFLAQGPKS